MSTKKVGRPRIDSEMVRSRLPRETLDALDAFIASPTAAQHDIETRPEAVRYLLRDHLIGLGYIKLTPDDFTSAE